jgi:hypothetical protein
MSIVVERIQYGVIRERVERLHNSGAKKPFHRVPGPKFDDRLPASRTDHTQKRFLPHCDRSILIPSLSPHRFLLVLALPETSS